MAVCGDDNSFLIYGGLTHHSSSSSPHLPQPDVRKKLFILHFDTFHDAVLCTFPSYSTSHKATKPYAGGVSLGEHIMNSSDDDGREDDNDEEQEIRRAEAEQKFDIRFNTFVRRQQNFLTKKQAALDAAHQKNTLQIQEVT
uniref:Solute carrier family 13 member 4 n=1 Tax=Lygus hesperus TaxID=30085 RepID=A0A0A9Z3Q4_LYGHE